MAIGDRILSIVGLQRKEAAFPPTSASWTWGDNLYATWNDLTPQQMIDYYTCNPIAFACIRVLADGFAQAKMKAYKPGTDDEIPNHRAAKLLQRPNYIMGQSEFWKYVVTYAAFGGNEYSHIVPMKGGLPGELWPYHANQIVTVPKGNKWVDHYAFNYGGGRWESIDPYEIIHVKWAVDPDKPYKGLSPMNSAAKAIDTHTEFTRLRKAILQNDAIVRTALKRDKDARPLSKDEREQMKRDFAQAFGGSKAGGVALLEGGADIVRMALNFDELQASELTASLEADICAAFGVHPVMAKVKLGLDKSTYSNYEEAVRDFTRSNLVPMWNNVADEFTNSLAPYYGDNFELRFDLTDIEALQESNDAREARALAALQGGGITLNDYLSETGRTTITGADTIRYLPSGVDVIDDILKKVAEPPPAPVVPMLQPPAAQSDQQPQEDNPLDAVPMDAPKVPVANGH